MLVSRDVSQWALPQPPGSGPVGLGPLVPSPKKDAPKFMLTSVIVPCLREASSAHHAKFVPPVGEEEPVEMRAQY